MMAKLPKNFEDKINLDEQFREEATKSVVDFGIISVLKEEIDLTRWSCIEFIKKQRGSVGGAA